MSLSQPQLVELNSKMNQYFSLDEIESLCFDMGIDFESLGGEGKGGKVRELIAFCQRRGRDDELAAKVRAERPQGASSGQAAASPAAGSGDQYNFSAVAKNGGTATTTNYIGVAPQPAPASKPDKKITILFLAANPQGHRPFAAG